MHFLYFVLIEAFISGITIINLNSFKKRVIFTNDLDTAELINSIMRIIKVGNIIHLNEMAATIPLQFQMAIIRTLFILNRSINVLTLADGWHFGLHKLVKVFINRFLDFNRTFGIAWLHLN